MCVCLLLHGLRRRTAEVAEPHPSGRRGRQLCCRVLLICLVAPFLLSIYIYLAFLSPSPKYSMRVDQWWFEECKKNNKVPLAISLHVNLGRYSTDPVNLQKTFHCSTVSGSRRCLLVSTYVVCERLSVMHEPAGVVENLVQILQFTPILQYRIPPPPENENCQKSWHFDFSVAEYPHPHPLKFEI